MGHISVSNLGLLLVCAVILKAESRPHETDWQHEESRLPASLINTLQTGNHTQDGKVMKRGSCFICKFAVRGVKNYVHDQLTRRMTWLCGQFTDPRRRKCFANAWKLRDKIIHKLFPGDARSTCRQYKAC